MGSLYTHDKRRTKTTATAKQQNCRIRFCATTTGLPYDRDVRSLNCSRNYTTLWRIRIRVYMPILTHQHTTTRTRSNMRSARRRDAPAHACSLARSFHTRTRVMIAHAAFSRMRAHGYSRRSAAVVNVRGWLSRRRSRRTIFAFRYDTVGGDARSRVRCSRSVRTCV